MYFSPDCSLLFRVRMCTWENVYMRGKKSTQIDDRVSRVVESFFLMQFSYYSGARWFAVLCSRWAKRAQSKPTRTLEPLCAISRGVEERFHRVAKKIRLRLDVYIRTHRFALLVTCNVSCSPKYIYTYIRIRYTFIYKDRCIYILTYYIHIYICVHI